MSMIFDDISVGGQLMVGAGYPLGIGVNVGKIRGSGFIEGPLQVGTAVAFQGPLATLLVGKLKNSDASQPQYSIWCKGDSKFESNINRLLSFHIWVNEESGELVPPFCYALNSKKCLAKKTLAWAG